MAIPQPTMQLPVPSAAFVLLVNTRQALVLLLPIRSVLLVQLNLHAVEAMLDRWPQYTQRVMQAATCRIQHVSPVHQDIHVQEEQRSLSSQVKA